MDFFREFSAGEFISFWQCIRDFVKEEVAKVLLIFDGESSFSSKNDFVGGVIINSMWAKRGARTILTLFSKQNLTLI